MMGRPQRGCACSEYSCARIRATWAAIAVYWWSSSQFDSLAESLVLDDVPRAVIGEIDDLAPRAVLLLGGELEDPVANHVPGVVGQRLHHEPADQVLFRAGLHLGLVVLELPGQLVAHLVGHEPLARGWLHSDCHCFARSSA